MENQPNDNIDLQKKFIDSLGKAMSEVVDKKVLDYKSSSPIVDNSYPKTRIDLFHKYKDLYYQLINVDLSIVRAALLGSYPNYAAMEDIRISNYGKYIAQLTEDWRWHRAKINICTDRDKLIEMYLLCLDSWHGRIH